jgi:glucose/arabinose dehydrogenase
MIRSPRSRWLLAIFALLLFGGLALFWQMSQIIDIRPALGEGQVADLTAPPGFRVTVFAEGLDNVRFLALGPDGVLYAADRGNDRIVALPDADGNGVADEIRPFATGLNSPHSLVWHSDAWYVGVPSGVIRLRDRDGDGAAESQQVLIDDYPTSGHNTRTVDFLPDGRMVVSIGSSCNICNEEDTRRGTILVYDPPVGNRATGEQIFVSGLRNAVGLAIHAQTGSLWATNNGRDMLGDDLPPEAVYALEEGGDYGWPRCHNGNLEDPEYGFPGACDGVLPPVVEMQAHSAPMALAFYTGDLFPTEYRDDLFIAFHGSWNRSEPTGYKIVRLAFENGQSAAQVEDFVTGWLHSDGSASGRPVGLAVGADGALYISDDKGGIVYRVEHR